MLSLFVQLPLFLLLLVGTIACLMLEPGFLPLKMSCTIDLMASFTQ